MLPVIQGALQTMTVHGDKMKAALNDFMLATDLADWLVQKGIPFRDSHSIVGQVVREAEQRQCGLRDLSLDDIQAIHPTFEQDALSVWDFERSVEQRSAPGGTARQAVAEQISWARALRAPTSDIPSGKDVSYDQSPSYRNVVFTRLSHGHEYPCYERPTVATSPVWCNIGKLPGWFDQNPKVPPKSSVK